MKIMLKQLLNNLSSGDKAMLVCAFQQGTSAYVVIDDKYIGVHLQGTPHLEEIDKQGDWSYGRIIKSAST